MAEKNYYIILEVKSTATFDEIKSAYRILAKKYHPDKNIGNKLNPGGVRGWMNVKPVLQTNHEAHFC